MMYEETIEAAKRLSQIHADEDIASLSNAIFPGTHCPLFGALLVASYVKGLVVLNIGSEECTFYGKDFSRMRQKGKDLVFSLVTHKNDITFGIEDKVREAVGDIIRFHDPKAILLISTCVVELIGEDIGAIASALEKEVDIPLLFVKTEHFKCNSHMPGLSDTMAAFSKLMHKMPIKSQTVNVIGHRFDGFSETELCKLLKAKGVHVHMSIPSECTVEQLKTAGEAAINIVTDFTGLALAKMMAERLGQPYVVFEKVLDPDRILEGYLAIEKALGIDLSEEVHVLYQTCQKAIHKTSEVLKNKSFVYGNAPVKALECSDFLASLGMVPLWVQMRELYPDDSVYAKALLKKGHDPKVSRIANIVPMRTVYDTQKPDYYIGHENPMELMKRNIKQLTFDREASGLGFQLTLAVLEKLRTEPSVSMRGGHR